MAYPFPSYHPYAHPTTSSRSGDKKNSGKRERTTYNKEQLQYLEAEFRIGKYPEPPRREGIALKLGLEDGKIQIWFKNRRAKERNEEKQIKIDALMGSTGSIPSASSTNKSSPSSKVDCSPDSTTVSPRWVKKECDATVSSPPSATVPTSLACMPTALTWSSPDSSMAPTSSSPPGATVPMFAQYPLGYPWMMSGGDPTMLPAHQINSSDPAAAAANQAYAMQYSQYYNNMFYSFDPSFNSYFPAS